ncbi:MAG: Gfo/Idh/MocA family oxidoreductase [Victivallaceae bacterium]
MKNDLKKIKAGVVGLRMGGEHLTAYLESDKYEVAGICDVDEQLLRRKAQESNAPLVTNDYTAIINNPEIELVSIATPDHLHAEQCIKALNAGKHVLAEKPLALTIEECKKIIEAADASHGTFMIGQVCRFAPGFKMAKELIEGGMIGDLFFIESEYAHDYEPTPGWQNWRKDHTVRRNGVLGGGCHAVDLLRWIGGDIETVTAFANHNMMPEWPEPDTTIANLKFCNNNLIGKVFVSISVQRPYTMRSVFYGSAGTIVCDNTSPSIQLFSHKIPGARGFAELPVNIASHNISGEVEYLYKVLREGKKLELTAREATKTVATCLAIIDSARNNGIVTNVDNNF